MPGNEFGDRIHNFLAGESLSPGQHHLQVFDGTWSGSNNNLWVGSQSQVGGPLVSSLKNFSVHQLDVDRGHYGQSSNLQHGMNFTHSGLRPESARSQSVNQSSIVNGFLQGHQAFNTRQNGTNFLGVNTASRDSDLHKKNSMRSESTESPVNYDFFGGQQQINGQHPGMIQPFPRQKVGRTDMQLLQQHAALNKMQELQRQQIPTQFQLPEARQLSSVNQVSTVVKQGPDSLSPAPINGVPVHSASNYTWQSEHMTVNANWLQDGASPAMQGSSSGFLLSPEQGQMHSMALASQQVDQSFYGVSTSGAIVDQYQYSSVQMDKPLMQQVPASSNSFPVNRYAIFPDQVGLQDGSLVSVQGDQGNIVSGAAAGQGLNRVFLSENLQESTIQPKNAVMQESSGRQGHPGPSETSLGKSLTQASPCQAVATLDPTEEKILFGSDDSMWDIFGRSDNTGSVLDGMDSSGAFPSLHSGSWSALMQSAVAETSSNDIGIQEEWSGLNMQNSKPQSGNMPTSIVNHGSKQQSAWVDGNMPASSMPNSKPFPMPQRSLQPSQSSDHRGAMYDESGCGSGFDLPNIESGNVNSSLGCDNFAASTDSRTTRVTKESSQQLSNSRNLNLWRSVDSKVNHGPSRVPEKYQQNQEKRPQTFDSSGNNCLNKGASEVNMSENPNIKEFSNDSFCSNIPQYTSTGGLKDNVWVDGNDLRGGKQKSSAHISHKPFVARKFQYHPMGDLDVEVEPSYGTKSATHSQATSLHGSQELKGHDQGYSGKSQFTGHAGGETTEVEKGCFPGLEVDKVPSQSSNPSSALDRSFGGFVPNKTSPTSQNMLELFQKVDQPRERGTATHLSSSEHKQSSEMAEAETSDGSVSQFEHNRPTTSQGFGLRLGPPSQKFTISDRPISSRSSPQGVNSLNLVNVSSGVERKGHTWLDTATSVQSSTCGASHGDIRSNVSSVSGQTSNKVSPNMIKGNDSAGFTSNHHYLKSHIQSQHITSASSQVTPMKSVSAPFGGLTSQLKQPDNSSVRAQPSQGRKSAPRMPKTAPDDNLTSSKVSWLSSSNQNHARDPGPNFPVLEASEPSTSESSQGGASTKNLPNLRASVSAPQHLSGAPNSLSSQSLFKPNHLSNKSDATHPETKKLNNQIAAGGSGQFEFPADSAKSQSFVGEKQPVKGQQVLPKNDASQNPAAMQRDIEAFGRSLRPTNAVNQNNLLLHQVQAQANLEIDPSGRSVKRFKGSDSALDAQQVGSHGQDIPSYGSDTMMRDATVNCPLDPSEDSKMPSFSSNTGDNHETQLSSNDMLASSQNGSQHILNATNSAANLKGEHSQISPQMAPSCFGQYGMFKNGQMMPIYDIKKTAMMKATEKAFIDGRPVDSLHPLHSSEQVNAAAAASQVNNARESSNLITIGSNHFSPHSLCPDVTNQDLVVRAKKRKITTFELIPWHREVTQGSQKPQNIRRAEAEWAHAAKRLIEKIDGEPEMIEEWSPVIRSKRRLILTTQLMQQLLCAPPRVVLSADASKNYETVAYFAARSVLGDACCTLYIPESDTADPPDSGSILSEKLKEERNECILKAVEEVINRAKKLENYVQSLDKRASVLDLRLECQDLEKVSVINRFAMFHSRGQADGHGAETLMSSDAIASCYKFYPRRYVTAVPMPRNLPDGVQCLSL
ncbi:hypothetical protein V6N13_125250 [Hibiscus sabdariffa]